MNITIMSRVEMEKLIKTDFHCNTDVISFKDIKDNTMLDFCGLPNRIFSIVLDDLDIDELEEYGLNTDTYFSEAEELAQLVSDDSHIPIRFAIFNGTTKASTMYSVREFGNTCILFSLDKVLEYGDVLNVPQADERGRKVERKEVPLFDEEAFREAIVNAFVHNQWITGNALMITVFSDRIEILCQWPKFP